MAKPKRIVLSVQQLTYLQELQAAANAANGRYQSALQGLLLEAGDIPQGTSMSYDLADPKKPAILLTPPEPD